ncbi:MAG: response regulator transcription factor [Verrucomicrobiota bacterium]
MSTSHTVVLVDDHPAFRLGVRQVIASDPQFRVVGEASDGQAALELIRRVRPDLAVVDINLPKLSGLELVRQLVRERLRTRVVVLTMYQQESLFQEAMDLGVAGYVLKENAVDDILHCLQAVGEGGCYLSPSLSGLLLRQRQSQQNLRHQTPGLDDLTPMERRILKLIAENKTSKQIGTEFFISPRTVETHRRNICLKLGLSGSHPLLQFALENRASL